MRMNIVGMNIGRFKLSKISIAEIVAGVLFFFLGLYYWTTGLNNMKYARNFQNAVDHYPVNRVTEVRKGIANAESAKVKNKVALALFKANFLLDQGKVEEALEIYKEAESAPFADDSQMEAAIIGKAVSHLYLTEKLGKIDLSELKTAKNELEKIAKTGDSDAYVALGHIHLKFADYYQAQKGEEENVKDSLECAERAFTDAEKCHDPEDMPLSKGGCLSLYVGQGLVYSRQARMIGNKKSSRKSEYFHKAAQSFRRALLLYVPKIDLILKVAGNYAELLTILWLKAEERGEYHKEAEETLRSMATISSNIFYIDESKQGRWQEISASLNKLFLNSLAISEMLQGQENTSASGTAFQYYQAELASIANQWESKKQAGRVSIQDFIVANNYLTLIYNYQSMRWEDVKNSMKILKESAAVVSGHRFYVAGVEEPVTPEQIMRHNLRIIYAQTQWQDIVTLLGRKPGEQDRLYK